MSSFSERMGIVKPRVALELNEMPSSLQDGLWDLLSAHFFNNIRATPRSQYSGLSNGFQSVCVSIWYSFYRESVDDIPPRADEARSLIRERFFEWKYNRAYDFLEFLSGTLIEDEGASFRSNCNSHFEREHAAVRFVGEIIAPITNEIEHEELEIAMDQSDVLGVQEHIKKALRLFSQEAPDYANSVKEAISAVESAVKFVSGTSSSGVQNGLKAIVRDFDMPESLQKGYAAIYGYTSGPNGIRHPLLDRQEAITQDEARYMMVSCSSFANYLLALKARSE
ncbi:MULTISPECIES: AbiJ-NTD4 domain-containing protein [Falsihalocynthiibacter]|uniref:AbiJ-NTD4 domain-containing protein n=1 Tax=Falsihalocynthiibacter TaxID=2854182 RepID=UPI0030026CD3